MNIYHVRRLLCVPVSRGKKTVSGCPLSAESAPADHPLLKFINEPKPLRRALPWREGPGRLGGGFLARVTALPSLIRVPPAPKSPVLPVAPYQGTMTGDMLGG